MLHRLCASSLPLAAFVAALTLAPYAQAVTTRPGTSSGGLEAVGAAPPLRRSVAIAYDRAPDSLRGPWIAFLQEAHAGSAASPAVAAWHAAWDLDTGVPSRVFGEGIDAPGTSSNAKLAEAHARAFLARHIALLAPGSSPDDLILATNEVVDGQRFVAFSQTTVVAGRRVPVVGGQVSLRYRADRLFMLASEAAPSSSFAALRSPVRGGATASRTARAFVLGSHGQADAATPELVALPLVRSGSVETRAAFRVRVEADAPRARYDVYVDAHSGAVIAREQLLRFAEGSAEIDAPVRGPNDVRQLYGARFADVVVDGLAASATADGGVTFPGPGPATVGIVARGTYVAVTNWGGDPASATLSVADGASVPWSLATDELGDAQLSGYVHTNIAKEHARAIAPEALGPWLDARMTVNVNRPDVYGCNAFWDGNALNFLAGNGPCNNSARVSDVVYHEFGHGFHQHSAKAAAGSLDAALGEGSGDFYAASITGDPLLAPGFYQNGTGLRSLDGGARWPDDVAWDPHETGLIWGGAMWDLRVALQAKLGSDVGAHIADVLFHAILGGASNIPSTYVEALAADDDDGNLANGTPHVCELNAAFAMHGLGHIMNAAGLSLEHEQLSVLAPGQTPYPLRVTQKMLFPKCAGAGVDSLFVGWSRSDGTPGDVTLTKDGDAYVGSIPGQGALTALTYQVNASVGGVEYLLPDNPADPAYQAFVGEVEPVYCNDFEHDVDGWALGNGGSNDFQWGTPAGEGGDPPAAFSGKKVIGDRLDGDGLYKPGRKASAVSPVVDIDGRANLHQSHHLHLMFRRWLTVEDGAFDTATVSVNDTPVWQNAATDTDTGALEHIDREWRFVDIDLAPYLQEGDKTVQVRFELKSGSHGRRGGWNIDDFCIVSAKQPPKAKPSGDADAGADGGDATPEPAAATDNPSGCALGRGSSGSNDGMLALGAALALLATRRRRR